MFEDKNSLNETSKEQNDFDEIPESQYELLNDIYNHINESEDNNLIELKLEDIENKYSNIRDFEKSNYNSDLFLMCFNKSRSKNNKMSFNDLIEQKSSEIEEESSSEEIIYDFDKDQDEGIPKQDSNKTSTLSMFIIEIFSYIIDEDECTTFDDFYNEVCIYLNDPDYRGKMRTKNINFKSTELNCEEKPRLEVVEKTQILEDSTQKKIKIKKQNSRSKKDNDNFESKIYNKFESFISDNYKEHFKCLNGYIDKIDNKYEELSNISNENLFDINSKLLKLKQNSNKIQQDKICEHISYIFAFISKNSTNTTLFDLYKSLYTNNYKFLTDNNKLNVFIEIFNDYIKNLNNFNSYSESEFIYKYKIENKEKSSQKQKVLNRDNNSGKNRHVEFKAENIISHINYLIYIKNNNKFHKRYFTNENLKKHGNTTLHKTINNLNSIDVNSIITKYKLKKGLHKALAAFTEKFIITDINLSSFFNENIFYGDNYEKVYKSTLTNLRNGIGVEDQDKLINVEEKKEIKEKLQDTENVIYTFNILTNETYNRTIGNIKNLNKIVLSKLNSNNMISDLQEISEYDKGNIFRYSLKEYVNEIHYIENEDEQNKEVSNEDSTNNNQLEENEETFEYKLFSLIIELLKEFGKQNGNVKSLLKSYISLEIKNGKLSRKSFGSSKNNIKKGLEKYEATDKAKQIQKEIKEIFTEFNTNRKNKYLNIVETFIDELLEKLTKSIENKIFDEIKDIKNHFNSKIALNLSKSNIPDNLYYAELYIQEKIGLYEYDLKDMQESNVFIANEINKEYFINKERINVIVIPKEKKSGNKFNTFKNLIERDLIKFNEHLTKTLNLIIQIPALENNLGNFKNQSSYDKLKQLIQYIEEGSNNFKKLSEEDKEKVIKTNTSLIRKEFKDIFLTSVEEEYNELSFNLKKELAEKTKELLVNIHKENKSLNIIDYFFSKKGLANKSNNNEFKTKKLNLINILEEKIYDFKNNLSEDLRKLNLFKLSCDNKIDKFCFTELINLLIHEKDIEFKSKDFNIKEDIYEILDKDKKNYIREFFTSINNMNHVIVKSLYDNSIDEKLFYSLIAFSLNNQITPKFGNLNDKLNKKYRDLSINSSKLEQLNINKINLNTIKKQLDDKITKFEHKANILEKKIAKEQQTPKAARDSAEEYNIKLFKINNKISEIENDIKILNIKEDNLKEDIKLLEKKIPEFKSELSKLFNFLFEKYRLNVIKFLFGNEKLILNDYLTNKITILYKKDNSDFINSELMKDLNLNSLYKEDFISLIKALFNDKKIIETSINIDANEIKEIVSKLIKFDNILKENKILTIFSFDDLIYINSPTTTGVK